jgi:hypothetical protein
MTEYALFYFLYFPLLNFHDTANGGKAETTSGVAAAPESGMKKAVSLLSHTGGLDTALASNVPQPLSAVMKPPSAATSPMPAKKLSHYKRKSSSTGIYATLLQKYLDYFLPLSPKKNQQPNVSREASPAPSELGSRFRPRGDSLISRSFGGNTPMEHDCVSDSIFSCKYLDRHAQLRISIFFFSLLSQLWLDQSEFYVIGEEPTLVGVLLY